ncbi:MAG: hypothetical protein AAB296_10565, partial [Candidatus Desantisbacteria bacterium]
EVLGSTTIYNTAYMYYQNELEKWMPYAAAFATNTMHVEFVPIGTPTIVLTKSVDTEEVTHGGTMTYTITFENQGDGTATNCYLYDSIPVGCELDLDTTPPAWGSGAVWYSYNGGTDWTSAWGTGVTTIRWYIGTIPPCPSSGYDGDCCFTVKVK